MPSDQLAATMILRGVPLATRRLIRLAAASRGETMQAWMLAAFQAALDRQAAGDPALRIEVER